MTHSANFMHKRPFVVSVEGNIGSGKSTILKYFETNCDQVDCRPEPIHRWTDLDGHNALGKLYSKPDRWAFTFNMFALVTRLQSYIQPVPLTPVMMQERSTGSAQYVFMKNSFLCNDVEPFEMSVINEWFKYLQDVGLSHVDLYVYVRASPELCLSRVQTRGRPQELGISLEFLNNIHKYHEEWLFQDYDNRSELFCSTEGVPVLVLESEDGLDAMNAKVESHRERILGHKKEHLLEEECNILQFQNK